MVGSCEMGYITSIVGASKLFPLSPVSSKAASNGWGDGPGTRPPADHMCLECADVSFGAPAGSYNTHPPTSVSGAGTQATSHGRGGETEAV